MLAAKYETCTKRQRSYHKSHGGSTVAVDISSLSPRLVCSTEPILQCCIKCIGIRINTLFVYRHSRISIEANIMVMHVFVKKFCKLFGSYTETVQPAYNIKNTIKVRKNMNKTLFRQNKYVYIIHTIESRSPLMT